MDITQIMTIGAALVPCVAYIVTTMSFAKQNRHDIMRLDKNITTMDGRLSAVEQNVAIINTMVTTLSQKEQERDARMSGLEQKMTALEHEMTTKISGLERDISVIKAICQERAARNEPIC